MTKARTRSPLPRGSSRKSSALRRRGSFLALGELVQPSRKVITAFALPGDFDPATLKFNLFELEWPRGSRRMQSFPEIDRAQWFAPGEAREKIQSGQVPFIDRLLQRLGG